MNDYCVGYRDFVQQDTGTDEDKRLRPDLVVKLPNNKNIVVDAKAILEAYVDPLQMPDGGQRLDKLKEHARLNRDHLANLGQKMCWKQFAPTPNLSSCFCPERYSGQQLATFMNELRSVISRSAAACPKPELTPNPD